MLTQQQLTARVRDLGLQVSKTAAGEYRVAHTIPHYADRYPDRDIGYWRKRQEDEAYYCEFRDDAYATAIKMAQEAKQ